MSEIQRSNGHDRHSASSSTEVLAPSPRPWRKNPRRRDVVGPSSCGCGDPITSNLYSDAETSGLPADAVTASLGCGNPTALHRPRTRRDRAGSGLGRRHRRVAVRASASDRPERPYGLDMTDEMLALARENQAQGRRDERGVPARARSRAVPLPDNSVDVIISNCVINLSSDKDAVLREAFRVLKPGGRFAVSDVVVRGDVPADVRRSMELWVGCIAGALEEPSTRPDWRAAGFRGRRRRAVAHLQRRRRARLPHRDGSGCRCARATSQRQVRECVRSCHKATRDVVLRSGVLLVKPARNCAKVRRWTP